MSDVFGRPTRYSYYGDPVTGSGWVAAQSAPARDCYSYMSVGPFDMELWQDDDLDGLAEQGEPGVQRLVYAFVHARGSDNLYSTHALKYVTGYAHNMWANDFQLPELPVPVVSTSLLNGRIILDWSESEEQLNSFLGTGYEFEGFNIYQGVSASGPWILLDTYDKVNGQTVVQDRHHDLLSGLTYDYPAIYGTDHGLRFKIDITTDVLAGSTNLVNNKLYHFAVTAYAWHPTLYPRILESPLVPISVRPHADVLGTEWTQEVGDTLFPVQYGNSEAQAWAILENPLDVDYESFVLGFDYDSINTVGSWSLLKNQDTLYSSDDLDGHTTPYLDGISITLQDVSFENPEMFHSWEQMVDLRPDSVEVVACRAISYAAVDSLILFEGDTVHLQDLVQTSWYGEEGQFDSFNIRIEGAETWVDLIRSIEHRLELIPRTVYIGRPTDLFNSIWSLDGGIQSVDVRQADLELRFNSEGQNATFWSPSTGHEPTPGWVPFQLWDAEHDIQLCVAVLDNNGNQTALVNASDSLDTDYFISIHRDYASFGDSLFQIGLSPSQPNHHTGWVMKFSDDGSFHSRYSVGDVFRVRILNPVTAGIDWFEFSIDVQDTDLSNTRLQEQLERINVFPNPYFGINAEEMSGESFVTFTHLPAGDCTLRIYSLGGTLVRTIEHQNTHTANTPFEHWDLRNKLGEPVASGMYIVHVDVPGVGSKVLKLAVMQRGF